VDEPEHAIVSDSQPEGFQVPPGMTSAFSKWFDDNYDAARQWFEEAQPLETGAGGTYAWTRNPEAGKLDALLAVSPEMLITKHASIIEVSDELLMDTGVIPDTRGHKPIPWRRRLRWKTHAWRTRTARRAYKIIDGDWPDNREDD
jgi:hypothetical protein